MGNDRINICLSTDDNYSRYAGVVIASILSNADENDELHFYILDGGIKPENRDKLKSLNSLKPCKINFIEIDETKFDDYKKVKTHDYISIASYYLLKTAELLPDIDKVVYLDCDVIVNTSLKELFNTDTKDYLMAGVNDNKLRMVKENPTYVNSGMLVLDLNNMRKDGTENKFFEYTKENIDTITKGDQEIINEVCKGKIKVIEPEWNVQTSNFVNRSIYTKSPKIIHYLSKEKPWKFGSYSYYKQLWFKHLQLTPWALKDNEKLKWGFFNQVISILNYIKHRPLFFLRPRFYKAVFLTYIMR